MNYHIILHTLGWVLNFEAICMLFPMICSLCYREPTAMTFALCIGICLLCGVLLTARPPKNKTMYAREGFVIVALSWILMSLFGCLPFLLSGSIPRFADAFFETVSGFTTTGASILTDVEALPRGMLFWRSFTHWIGGMGVLVFLVAILPLSGGSNLYLIKAESPGPSISKLVPRIRSSAKILYEIYAVMTVIQIVLLLLGGMPLFDALTISFGTAGTGGFAIKNSGLSEYSAYIQNVTTVFMLLFGINFSLYYLLLLRKFKEVLHSDELRAYLGIVLTSTIFIWINIAPGFESALTALKHSAFQVASIITTTGYSTLDFDLWPSFSKTILIILMFIGACAGSTGGGIKVSRILILLKSVGNELKRTVHPRSTQKITLDHRLIEHETLRSINVFIAAYAAIFIVSLLLVSLDQFDFTANFTAIATAINNIGPGFAEFGPTKNFSAYSDLSKYVMSFNMLAGRLEIFPILLLFSPHTWKK